VIIGVPKESYSGERRVALIPKMLPNLQKAGLQVVIETGAGIESGYRDGEFEEKGGEILSDRAAVFRKADIILQVLCYGSNDLTGKLDIPLFRKEQFLFGFLRPLGSREVVQEIADTGITSFAVELMPRITRAQSMDVLSSMATICGYKAVLTAAETIPRMFPMLTTAAGTLTPAKVLVIGAGVAGLQAIGTARRLGGIVTAYDLRPVVKEQVQSLGARFLELPIEAKDAQDAGGYAKEQDESFYARQRELLGNAIAESDVVITTAVVPGRNAPVLVTKDMVRGMAPGSVIVDLAAERGGNCELTRPGEKILENGVSIIGSINMASSVPTHASQMYAKNLTTFLTHLTRDGRINVDLNDQITRDTLLTQSGEIVNERVRQFYQMPALAGQQP
jgi:NAD(P) transhydrogenase subunit alpha